MFVVVEGVDGSGKGTHAALLAERMNAALVKYPDRSTPIGRLIDLMLKGERALADVVPYASFSSVDGRLLHTSADDALALQGLMLANRIETQGTLHRLLTERDVVADRYSASSFAYGKADGVDATWLIDSHRVLTQPVLTVILDVPVEEAVRRIAKRVGDDTYGAVRERIAKARENYQWYAQHGPYAGRCVLIDATQPVDAVHESIFSAVSAVVGRLDRF